MKVWNIAGAEAVYSFVQAQFKPKSLQWSDDESCFFRLVSNEIQVFDGSSIASGVKNRIHCKSLTQFQVIIYFCRTHFLRPLMVSFKLHFLRAFDCI